MTFISTDVLRFNTKVTVKKISIHSSTCAIFFVFSLKKISSTPLAFMMMHMLLATGQALSSGFSPAGLTCYSASRPMSARIFNSTHARWNPALSPEALALPGLREAPPFADLPPGPGTEQHPRVPALPGVPCPTSGSSLLNLPLSGSAPFGGCRSLLPGLLPLSCPAVTPDPVFTYCPKTLGRSLGLACNTASHQPFADGAG